MDDNNDSNNNNPSHSNADFNRNANFSYLAQQSFRASFTSADVGRRQVEFPRNPLEVRGSIQRELEKERIRAEIIMEEMMQRRILEAEVRRELMLERELALRRGESGFGIGRLCGPLWLEPQQVPLLTNFEHREGFTGSDVSLHREAGFRGGFETMPFQRDPVVTGSGSQNGGMSHEFREVKGILGSSEAIKDKVIILAKPTPNLADIKRKAMAGAAEVVKKQKKQKTNDDWSCALCRITATSERGLKEHLQGKKHKTRERQMLAPRTGFGTGPSSKMGTTNTSKPFTLPIFTDTPIVKEDGDVHNASSSNPSSVSENHILIKSKEVSIEQIENRVPKPSATDKRKKKFRFFCEMCNAGAYSKRVFNAHIRGKKHLANLSQIGDAAQVEACAQKVAMVENMEAKMGAKGTKGEQVDDVNNAVNRGDMEKVLEMGAEETKQGIKGENVEFEVDDVDSDVTQVEDKEMIIKMSAKEIKEGTEGEQVDNKIDVVHSDVNRVEGKKALEMGVDELKEGIEEEHVKTKVSNVDSDVNLAEYKETNLEMGAKEIIKGTKVEQVDTKIDAVYCAVNRVEGNKALELGAEENKQGNEGEQVETKVGDADNDVHLGEYKNALEMGAKETKECSKGEQMDTSVNDVDVDIKRE